MKVKNVSSRAHHIGNVMIAPGEIKEIPEAYESAINRDELVPQAEEKQAKSGKKSKADKGAEQQEEGADATEAEAEPEAK